MRFPKMRPQPARELKIPDLAGGLNLRDGVSEIMDNQLTESVNMWWQDGILKTRPSVKSIAQRETEGEQEAPDPALKSQNIKRHNCFKNKEQLCSTMTVGIYGNSNWSTWINFFWCGKNNIEKLPSININSVSGDINYFVARFKDSLYCYLYERDTIITQIYKMVDNGNEWEEIDENEIYAPLMYAHCKTYKWSLPDDAPGYMQYPEFSGDLIEGANLIGNRYRMIYSTVNKNLSKNYMVYRLGKELPLGIEADIEVKHTTSSGVTHIHKVKYLGQEDMFSGYAEDNAGTDNLTMTVYWPDIIKFTENGTVKELSVNDYIEDNLEIIAPYIPTDEEKQKIFNMTQTEWFGGYAEGLSGGTRLFLGGNTDSKEKALVCWSGLNNPLYFPENGYFYVGDSSDAVVGFGKQSDMLVIFKENETWFTKYNQNLDITASDLINQNIVDYTASSVYFTLTLINSNIGCGNADTVKLCRNRLVWLGNDNKVYTLVSNSQYNERSIFSISEMIQRKLSKEHTLLATACDWNGYYCLSFGEKLYLMDYNCYGYTHITSYSKTEDANLHIPWYYWELKEIDSDNLITLGTTEDLLFFNYVNLGAGTIGNVNLFIIDTENNNNSNIRSSFTTKLFDFGEPSLRKNIDKINLQLGNNNGVPIRIELITECGDEETEITLEGADTESYSASFIESKALFPCIRQVIKMGLKLSSEGVIAIDGMSFKYRKTGGAR